MRFKPTGAKQGASTKHQQNQYKNEVGQPADGDYVGNWCIMCPTYSGDKQGRLESVPGLSDGPIRTIFFEQFSTDFGKDVKKHKAFLNFSPNRTT